MLVLSLWIACRPPGPPPDVQPLPGVAAATSVDEVPWTIATLPLPGDPPYAEVARDLIAVSVALEPSLAAENGLYEDAIAVPSYAPEVVEDLLARVDADLERLRALPWDALTVDQQIDVRWLVARGELLQHRLRVERRWEHRPAEWLEPLGYALVALSDAAPEYLPALVEGIPAMVEEMGSLVVAPTARDVVSAREITEGIVAVLQSEPVRAAPSSAKSSGETPNTGTAAAVEALRTWAAALPDPEDLPEYAVIGAEAYAWRLDHALLLPWDPDELLAIARAELDRVDAELAALPPGQAWQPPDAWRAEAAHFTRDDLLALYDDAVAENLAALRRMDIVSVPDDLPPIVARETPPPMIPLTGDGGSMNPPPLYGPPRPAYWNVETWRPEWTPDHALGLIVTARGQAHTWFGWYAVHEGVPGHHLQLAMARRLGNPVRTLLADTPSVEGWALYAEQAFWEGGVACTRRMQATCGFGDGVDAHRNMLRAYRARIRRVIYDVRVETGAWTLQEAAEWRAGAEGVPVDRDVLRAIHWPTQLIAYFAGKQQLIELRDELRARGMDDRDIHDAILAEGQVPIALIRAKLLGGPVPPPPAR
ncbi:MAG: DUF885 family protein [Deltaproteobacteria bacterium]|nr:MAG: DUF885 family protein [Deltaproteobacteria bacterium]